VGRVRFLHKDCMARPALKLQSNQTLKSSQFCVISAVLPKCAIAVSASSVSFSLSSLIALAS